MRKKKERERERESEKQDKERIACCFKQIVTLFQKPKSEPTVPHGNTTLYTRKVYAHIPIE